MDTNSLIYEIESALGHDRLTYLKKNEDKYQQFWLGVLEAFGRMDKDRDFIGFLISNGYGAIRNMNRSEYSKSKMKRCLTCGKLYGYRTRICPKCYEETETQVRTVSTYNREGEVIDYEDTRNVHDINFSIDIESFLLTLEGNQKYIARRWFKDRVDMLFVNHVKQLAFELEISEPRVTQIKNIIRKKFKSWYFGIN